MFVVGSHTEAVYALAFAPDGRTLASASKDGTARLWDLAGGGEPITLGHVGSPVQSLAFSPDGRLLATGTASGAVNRWDAATGKVLSMLQLVESVPVSGLAFLAEGRLLAGASGRRLTNERGGRLVLWDLTQTPARLQVVETDPHGYWSVAATPGGKTLAWGSGDRLVTVWDVTSPDRRRLPPAKKGVLAVALPPDGRAVAYTDDWAVRLWDVADRRERTTLTGHKGRVSALAFAPDGRTLMSGGWDKRVTLWDAATGRPRQTFDWDIGRVLAVAFSPDGLLAAAAGDAGRVVVWDVE